MSSHESKHIVNGKVVKMVRQFKPEHLAAGYDKAEFSAPATNHHQLLGEYQGTDGKIVVRYLDRGPTGGPEFQIEVENGPTITTLHEDAVAFHLVQFGAASFVEEGGE